MVRERIVFFLFPYYDDISFSVVVSEYTSTLYLSSHRTGICPVEDNVASPVSRSYDPSFSVYSIVFVRVKGVKVRDRICRNKVV